MILPDLGKRVAYYQDVMRPDNPEMGNGIADWTITVEYRPDLAVPGVGDAWGCMCSPAALPEIVGLTSEDVAAKRAHIICRTPKTASEIPEVERTLVHELGHVLVAPMQSTNVTAEENAMHSLDALFAKFSPEYRQIFTRAMQNPKARAYSAPDGETMAEENKGPEGEKKSPEGEKPKAQEGAPRDIAAIQADIIKAAMAGQPTDELVKELVAAQALAGAAAAAPPPSEEPLPAAQMGMTQEQAYARAREADANAKAAHKEAIETIIDVNPHLTDAQKGVVRKQPNAAAARELVNTYPKPEAKPEKPKMGLDGHPATPKGGGTVETAMARACRLPDDEQVRSAMGYVDVSKDTGGVELDVPGHLIVMSLHKRGAEARARFHKESSRGAK